MAILIAHIDWASDNVDTCIYTINDFHTFIAGTPGNDVIIGTQGRDFAVGGDGDDWLSLLAGDDVGVGGNGRDWVSGDGDDDLLVGGNDDDHVIGGSGHDVLSGDAGTDELDGGSGNDVLAGGRGDGDLVAGGTGDDVYRFSRGDGRDAVIDAFAGTWETIWSGGNYVNGFSRDASNRILKGAEIVFDGTDWLVRVQFDVHAQQLRRLIPTAGRTGQDATVAGEAGDTIEFGLGIGIQDIVLAQQGYDLVVGVSRGAVRRPRVQRVRQRPRRRRGPTVGRELRRPGYSRQECASVLIIGPRPSRFVLLGSRLDVRLAVARNPQVHGKVRNGCNLT